MCASGLPRTPVTDVILPGDLGLISGATHCRISTHFVSNKFRQPAFIYLAVLRSHRMVPSMLGKWFPNTRGFFAPSTKENYANHALGSLFRFGACGVGDFSFIFCGRFRVREYCASGAAGLYAASVPGRWIHLDSRLLGLRIGWILLGARHLGGRTRAWLALDPWLLGLERWRISLARRLLGPAHWLLRRRQLRLRLFR